MKIFDQKCQFRPQFGINWFRAVLVFLLVSMAGPALSVETNLGLWMPNDCGDQCLESLKAILKEKSKIQDLEVLKNSPVAPLTPAINQAVASNVIELGKMVSESGNFTVPDIQQLHVYLLWLNDSDLWNTCEKYGGLNGELVSALASIIETADEIQFSRLIRRTMDRVDRCHQGSEAKVPKPSTIKKKPLARKLEAYVHRLNGMKTEFKEQNSFQIMQDFEALVNINMRDCTLYFSHLEVAETQGTDYIIEALYSERLKLCRWIEAQKLTGINPKATEIIESYFTENSNRFLLYPALFPSSGYIFDDLSAVTELERGILTYVYANQHFCAFMNDFAHKLRQVVNHSLFQNKAHWKVMDVYKDLMAETCRN